MSVFYAHRTGRVGLSCSNVVHLPECLQLNVKSSCSKDSRKELHDCKRRTKITITEDKNTLLRLGCQSAKLKNSKALKKKFFLISKSLTRYHRHLHAGECLPSGGAVDSLSFHLTTSSAGKVCSMVDFPRCNTDIISNFETRVQPVSFPDRPRPGHETSVGAESHSRYT